MGVVNLRSRPGDLTPICEDCGVLLCWDISFIDYEERREFWDNWRCKQCYQEYKRELSRKQKEVLVTVRRG